MDRCRASREDTPDTPVARLHTLARPDPREVRVRERGGGLVKRTTRHGVKRPPILQPMTIGLSACCWRGWQRRRRNRARWRRTDPRADRQRDLGGRWRAIANRDSRVDLARTADPGRVCRPCTRNDVWSLSIGRVQRISPVVQAVHRRRVSATCLLPPRRNPPVVGSSA